MRAQHFLILAAAALVALACSSAHEGLRVAGDDELIVPKSLAVSALEGGNGVLELFALTLRSGPSSTEAYAALRNTGDAPACGAAVSLELFDKAEQSVAAGISALYSKHLYRLTDGSGSIVACVAPAEVAMGAVTDLPAELVIESLGTVVYRCPYFALDVEPVDGLAISEVKSVAAGVGTAYTGTLHNGLEVTVTNPSVAVFPVNGVGRPLGVATGRGTVEIPPGGSWAFETNSVEAKGSDYVAYPAGSLVK